MENENCINEFNKLLRGEISAIETYVQAIELVEQPWKEELRDILKDHQKSAMTIKKHVQALGGEADRESGIWGDFARLVEGSAKLLGTSVAISALKQGELLGIGDYESAIKEDFLKPECRLLISKDLLPACEGHVDRLENILDPSGI